MINFPINDFPFFHDTFMASFLMTCIFFRSVAKQNKYEISQITMIEKVIDQENIWKLCTKTLFFQEREF